MNVKEYFKFAEDFFNKCLEISRKKNADYTGGNANPFANFESVELYGIQTPQGFLTRMQDKMMRIGSFVKNGELQVKDESVTDTLRDLANYACLLAGWIEAQKEQGANLPVTLVDRIKNAYSPPVNGFNFTTEFLEEMSAERGLDTLSLKQVNDVLAKIVEK